ncbi:MAG: hypothetical protein H0W78_04535 [Planctomycetes bacterium]|nr:hypothetical protein [Planctomycetota bacterium]
MIERYFRAGVRYLWNKPNDTGCPQTGPIINSSKAATPLTYDGLDGNRAAVDPMLLTVNVTSVLGIAKGANIAHDWLDYAPGGIARLPTGGQDILTGYMSGCLIIRGTYTGVMSAFHVGTIDNNPAVNRTVKRNFAQALPTDATGFSPAAVWPETNVILGRFGGPAKATPRIFGLITAAGAFHSILMFNVCDERGQWSNPAGKRYWAVGGIKAVPAMNRTRLMASLMS